MRQSNRLAGAVLLLTVGLATACTGGGDSAPREAAGPWTLNGLAATQAGLPIQRSIDLPPAGGAAKILGVAEIAGTDVILFIRGDTCQVAFLPDSLTAPTALAPTSVGASRPAARGGSSDGHQDFPGTVLDGSYTVATARLEPFPFTTVGCSEKAMSVRVEGTGESLPVKKSGDSLRLWREGRDALFTVGLPEAVHGPAPEHRTS